MIQTIAITSCGCYFEYEDDHSRPYLARWVLCGKPGCPKVESRLERARLDEEIRVARERLDALLERRRRMGNPSEISQKIS